MLKLEKTFKHCRLVVLIFATNYSIFSISQVPYLDWANGHSTGYSWGYSIYQDVSDNIYSTGVFYDTIIVPSFSGADTLISDNYGCFIQKASEDGLILWTRTLSGSGDVNGNSIVADSLGNVYVTGIFSGTVDFNPDENLTTNLVNTSSEIFILKLNSEGQFIWVKRMDAILGSTENSANSIIIDKENYLIVAGEFGGTVDFDPDIASTHKTSSGSTDIFVQKLDTSGSLIWIQTMPGTSIDNCYSITCDLENEIYLTGRFHGTVDFDPGVDLAEFTDPSGFGEIFVLKINSLGAFKWVNVMGGLSSDFGEDICTDKEGNVYTIGRFIGSVDFDAGSDSYYCNSVGYQNTFIQKTDSLGNFVFVKIINSSVGGSNYNVGRSIALDTAGNIFICGHFQGIIDLDPGVQEELHSSAGASDIFIEKLDSQGNFIWGITIGDAGTDLAEELTINLESIVSVTGCHTSYGSPVNFNPNGSSYYLPNYENRSSYIASYVEGFVNLDEDVLRIGVLAYPNPTIAHQTLVLTLEHPENLSIYLININGQTIKGIYAGDVDLRSIIEVDLSEISAGIYFYQFLINGASYFQKIVIN